MTFLPGWPGGLAVDGLSAVLLVTLGAVLAAVLVFAAGEGYGARFFGLTLLFAAAMAVTVTATDLVLLLMGWEVMGAMSYALIGHDWWDARRVGSAGVAFLTTRAADMGLYAAAGFAVAGAHSLRLDDLAAAGAPWRDLIAAGVVVSALGKSAQLPFSFWLSRAMDGPSPVSALLHSATMVAAGAYLLLRVHPLLAATGWAATLVTWAGAVTALVLGAVALAQRDLKQLLAASTCAQIGFMVLGAGAGALGGGTAQLVAHAAVKSLLFLCAGVWLGELGTKRLDALQGAARRHRTVGAAFGVGALALAGVPPLSLWVTKDEVLAGAVGSPALLAVGLAASVLSAAYAAKALLAAFRPGGGGGAFRVPLAQRAPLVPLACAAAALGALGLPPVADAWRRLLGVPDESGPGPWMVALSGVLAVVTVGAVMAVRRIPEPAWALRWLWSEDVASAMVVRPAFAMARALARFDDRVVDGAVRGVARGGQAIAGLAGRRVEFRLDGLVAAVGRAARGLGALARRPQTGQVHLYYAQAAVVLAVLVVVAVLAG
ncbi:NADH-quinone oxidoreductase subunit 5 family protein [Actinomadura citrea]|uniref:NADH:ubiquinone oxidoreductase subunit 5 (Subunit L)/multisubunit Na+/H+ antiporter MnhA subunit n=1 Tax=Actinomadura citrea TaxID=46158 RepID=A0A7Y9G8W5_9ACTN|nr:proton-conducting transporter membrane subunit [Actinomadura citrea]NYE12026.1 NADH:ubiquinone oxidoreductase subunit 5 (subunit L)/multisubunit Na+/H+ antiporter MnhA subunit [Actinomadura citrea]